MKPQRKRLLISWTDCRDDAERAEYVAYAERCGYPRNAQGQHGHWQQGSCFAPGQCEDFSFPRPPDRLAWSTFDSIFHIVPLEDGTWLAESCCYRDTPRYTTRADAIDAAVRNVITRCQMRANDRSFSRLSSENANAIIRWACGLADLDPSEYLVGDEAPAQRSLFSKVTI